MAHSLLYAPGMDLTSPAPFWPQFDGTLHTYTRLDADISTEVAIIGGGVTGAIVADLFTREGIPIVVLDKRAPGCGSTSASTALLMYEIDTDLNNLIELRGEHDAVRAYRLCRDAVFELGELAKSLKDETGDDCGYAPRHSLYLAADGGEDVDRLKIEYETRCRFGFETRFLTREDIESATSFSRPAALLCPQAAQIDPYRFAHRLLERAVRRGARVFSETEMSRYEADDDGVTLSTKNGPRVRAKRVIFATGYEAKLQSSKDIVHLKSTYVAVSEPVDEFPGWPADWLIWETARPYLYLRRTQDNRIMVGGEDDEFSNPFLRDRRIRGKTERLIEKFNDLFPGISFRLANSYAGTFGETQDGLAFIGEDPEYPRGIFCLGFGGNGITFSTVGARIALNLYRGIPDPDSRLFRFDENRSK